MLTKKIKKNKEKSKKLTQEEFEEKVLKLAEKNLTSEKIGEELRKQNIHPKNTKKRYLKFLEINILSQI